MKKNLFVSLWMGLLLILALQMVYTNFLLHRLNTALEAKAQSESAPAALVSYKGLPMNQAPTATATETPTPPTLNFVETAKLATPSVINISVKDNSTFRQVSGGSGIIVSSDGYIVTNDHVISGGNLIEVTLPNKRSYQAQLIGKDPSTDLALIKIDAAGLPPIHYGDSGALEVGEWVLAIGNPFNLKSTVTAGIISAKGRNINILNSMYAIESFIQTDAAVNSGNSGGALVNMNGELIGVNSAIMSESGGYEGYSFAIPVNLVRKVINDLKQFSEVQRAILGITILDVNDEIAKDFGLPSVEGVYVRNIAQSSSADKAGLRVNDVIVGVNDRPTLSVPELQEQVALYRPGDVVSLTVIRHGKRQKISNIVLQKRERLASESN